MSHDGRDFGAPHQLVSRLRLCPSALCSRSICNEKTGNGGRTLLAGQGCCGCRLHATCHPPWEVGNIQGHCYQLQGQTSCFVEFGRCDWLTLGPSHTLSSPLWSPYLTLCARGVSPTFRPERTSVLSCELPMSSASQMEASRAGSRGALLGPAPRSSSLSVLQAGGWGAGGRVARHRYRFGCGREG